MSTKIYDAYRIKKSSFPDKFIGDILHDLKKETQTFLFENEDLLKSIHIFTMFWLESSDDKTAEDLEKFCNGDGYDVMFPIRDYLQESEEQKMRSPLHFDIDLNCSIFEDKDYWYLKFFANTRWQWNLINEWEEKYEWLEDYHYQNQTDPPEDVPYEQFEKRDEKWDELTGDVDNYTNGLQYYFMNANMFNKLLFRSHYGSEIKIAYKFDKNPKKMSAEY